MTFGRTEQRIKDRNTRKRQKGREPTPVGQQPHFPLCAIVYITGGEKLLKCGPADPEPHLCGVWKSGCSRSWRTGCCAGCCWRGSRSSLGPGAGAGLCGRGWVSSNLTDCARSGFGGRSLWPGQPFLLTRDTVKTNPKVQPFE